MGHATVSRTRAGPEAREALEQPTPQSSRPAREDWVNAREQFPSEPRYRPGRGGYDPHAAALAAEAKYAFRQRMVLVLVLFAVISAVLAGTLRLTDAWYLHIGLDFGLVGYLTYLRRQVRMEQAIRARRAARLAGSRRGTAERGSTEDGTRRSRPPGKPMTVGEAVAAMEAARRAAHGGSGNGESGNGGTGETSGQPDAPGDERGEGAAVPDAEHPNDVDDQTPALPRLKPARPARPPAGTVRLELDDEDPELHDLADWQYRGYRRAAGQ